MKIIDKDSGIEKIDDETTQFIYDNSVIIFALDKDTCQRIVLQFEGANNEKNIY